MSVAFTREEDAEAAAADLPDRPISPHANLVTPAGLAQIEAALSAARAARTAASAQDDVSVDRTAMARATRDLRYYGARRASAQLITPRERPVAVAFGSTATIERQDGRIQRWLIVGEDEANPAAGSISYVSPLARALLGRVVGESVNSVGGEVVIIGIE